MEDVGTVVECQKRAVGEKKEGGRIEAFPFWGIELPGG
jgi:hypothetical protein